MVICRWICLFLPLQCKGTSVVVEFSLLERFLHPTVLIGTTCLNMFQMRMRNKLCSFVTWPFDCCRQLRLGRPHWWSYPTTPWSLCRQLHNLPSLGPRCCVCREGWSRLLPPLLWPSQPMELHIRCENENGQTGHPQAQQWGFLEPLRCWSFFKLKYRVHRAWNVPFQNIVWWFVFYLQGCLTPLISSLHIVFIVPKSIS